MKRANIIEKESSMWNRLEGFLNATKQDTLAELKKQDLFVEACKVKGFVYRLVNFQREGEAFNLEVGLKNGKITIYELSKLLTVTPLRRAI